MARIIVLLNSAQTQRIELVPEREYVVGRQETCDIILKEFPGLSRQHFKIHWEGEAWQVTLISKYGDLIFKGQPTQQISLGQNEQFTLGPYTFVYETAALPTPSAASGHPQVGFSGGGEELNTDSSASPLNDEVTSAGVLLTIPYIRMTDSRSGKEELLQLQGALWTAGRDAECEIVIKDAGASRRHFEIIQEHGLFYIADLGSSNGTELNGKRLTANISTPLHSGDRIQVEDIKMTFELRDPSFENKLAVISPETLALTPYYANTEVDSYPPQPLAPPGILRVPAGNTYPPSPRRKKNQQNAGPLRLILIVLIGVILAYAYLKPNPPPPSAQPQESAFDRLSEAEKKLVRQSLELARNLHMQAKYELALGELQKLHQIIEVYQDSREIEANAQRAYEILEEKKNMDAVLAEQEKRKEEAERIIAHCERQLRNSSSIEEAEACLLGAMEKDPENEKINTLKNQVNQRASAKIQKEQHRANQLRIANQVREEFQKARKLHQAGKKPEAVAAYQALIASPLPNIDQVKEKAKEYIQQIENERNRALNEKVKQAEDAFSKQNDRGAILAATAALRIDPKSETAMRVRDQARQRLNKSLKVMFEDSVIEEGFGNVEAAREKWHRIIEADVPGGEYHQKATQKIRKYGGG